MDQSIATNLLPVIITIIGVGVALAGFMLTVMLVGLRLLNQRIGESEERVTRLIGESEERSGKLARESEERVTKLIGESEERVTRLIGESEARLTQRIDDLGTRTQRLEREVAEVKGALGIIRDALSLRVGE